MALHVLLVEDDPELSRHLKQMFHEWQPEWKLTFCFTGLEAERILRSRVISFDLVLMDLELPFRDGFSLLQEFHQLPPFTPYIVMTHSGDSETARKAIEAGALDFLPKPLDPARLQVSIMNALQYAALQRYNERQRRFSTFSLTLKDLLGQSAAFQAMISQAHAACQRESPVLFLGEAGAGKQTLARAIHGHTRPGKPFTLIDCAFFTGHDIRALFQNTTEGTVYFHCIEHLSAESQRLLHERLTTSNMPIMASACRDLAQAVAEGEFDERLFESLHPYRLAVPALRQRERDAVLLAGHFMHEYAARLKLRPPGFSPLCAQAIAEHGWPENITELQTTLYHALIRVREARPLEPADLFPDRHDAGLRSFDRFNRSYLTPDGHPKPLDEIEREAIEHAIFFCNGHISKAAQNLRIGRSTLYRKMATHGIDHVNTVFRGKIIKPA